MGSTKEFFFFKGAYHVAVAALVFCGSFVVGFYAKPIASKLIDTAYIVYLTVGG